MPKRRGEASKSRGTPLGVWITTFSLVAVAGTSAYAAGFSLDDDSAVIVGSEGTIYSLDLTSGVATAGATLSGDTPADTSGVEADPTADTLYLIDTTPALISASPADGTGTYIEDDYTNLEVLDGIARTDDGVMYLSHIPAGEATAHISSLNLTTGVYTSRQEIDIAAGGGGGVISECSPSPGLMTLSTALL
jgi:hypothetical protein